MVTPQRNPASMLIDNRIRELGDWRGDTLARMRALILQAEPHAVEEWKWMGTPVWSCDGIICTGETYKQAVKLTFAKGAALPDPKRLFNASLEGHTRRAIDILEGEVLDERAFTDLVKAAVAQNRARHTPRARSGVKPVTKPAKATSKKSSAKKSSAKPSPKKRAVILSGGTSTSTRRTSSTRGSSSRG